MTQRDFDILQARVRGATGATAKRTTNSGNIRCEVDGLKFQSRKERDHYLLLRVAQDCGAITDLKCQVKFLLVDDPALNYSLCYIADFTYMRDGVLVVTDVKPYDKKKGEFLLKPTFKRKMKLMKLKYNIDIQIV